MNNLLITSSIVGYIASVVNDPALLATQYMAIEETARKNGHQVQILVETCVRTRPVLKQLIQCAHSGTISHIYIRSLDRLGRPLSEVRWIYEHLSASSVVVIVANETPSPLKQETHLSDHTLRLITDFSSNEATEDDQPHQGS